MESSYRIFDSTKQHKRTLSTLDISNPNEKTASHASINIARKMTLFSTHTVSGSDKRSSSTGRPFSTRLSMKLSRKDDASDNQNSNGEADEDCIATDSHISKDSFSDSDSEDDNKIKPVVPSMKVEPPVPSAPVEPVAAADSTSAEPAEASTSEESSTSLEHVAAGTSQEPAAPTIEPASTNMEPATTSISASAPIEPTLDE